MKTKLMKIRRRFRFFVVFFFVYKMFGIYWQAVFPVKDSRREEDRWSPKQKLQSKKREWWKSFRSLGSIPRSTFSRNLSIDPRRIWKFLIPFNVVGALYELRQWFMHSHFVGNHQSNSWLFRIFQDDTCHQIYYILFEEDVSCRI